MSNSENLAVMCYLAWCGAEVSYGFADKSEHEAARAFLSGLAKVHFPRSELRPALSRIVTDYYILEEHDRTAFEKFMRNLKK